HSLPSLVPLSSVYSLLLSLSFLSFFFTAPATTAIYTLSLHDALPISARPADLARIVQHGPDRRGGAVRFRRGVAQLRDTARGPARVAGIALERAVGQRTHAGGFARPCGAARRDAG